jgi:hypothetical protein
MHHHSRRIQSSLSAMPARSTLFSSFIIYHQEILKQYEPRKPAVIPASERKFFLTGLNFPAIEVMCGIIFILIMLGFIDYLQFDLFLICHPFLCDAGNGKTVVLKPVTGNV